MNKQLFNQMQTCASAARFSELRGDGWMIEDKSVFSYHKNGKDYYEKEYFISRNNIIYYMNIQSVKDFIDKFIDMDDVA